MSATCLRLGSRALMFGGQSVLVPVSPLAAAATLSLSSHHYTSSWGNPIHSRHSVLQRRHISTTQTSFFKQIVERTEGEKTIVEARYIESPHAELVVKNEFADKKVCPLCALNLNIKHTDVLLLSQFVRPDGRLLPRRVTGLCCSQQYKITMLVTMAKKAGLMPNLAPANSHKDPSKRRGSKKYHRYFDETTIKDTRLKNIARYKDVTELMFPTPQKLLQ